MSGPGNGPATFIQVPFTYQQGLSAGISRRQLQSPRFRRLLQGIYVAASVEVDAVIEARAALWAVPAEGFASHDTAARLWGGIVPRTASLHASVPRGVSRPSRDGLVVHSSIRSPRLFRGVRVTSPSDTFLDCATLFPLVDQVILGDSLVRRGRITPEQLVRDCDEASGRGVRKARAAARLVRSGVDSPMETRARLLRVLAGLPELETDLRFSDDLGELVRRLDAGDRATKTGVEYHGRQHIERERHWEEDIGRREEFENGEWRIVTLVSRDIFITPGRTVARLRHIMVMRGMRVGPPSDDWRRHFPGKG